MKERLLYEWQDKYDRINWEYIDNEKKLEYVNKRQQDLVTDLVTQGIVALVCFGVICFIASFREGIYIWFLPFFQMTLFAATVAAIIYNGYQFLKKIKRYLHHTRRMEFIEYPGPADRRAKYARYPQPSYYAERKCVEWLLCKYAEEINQMEELKGRIENGSEQDCEMLQRELNAIIIYERVERARL